MPQKKLARLAARQQPPRESLWTQFATEFPGDSRLTAEYLYALPAALLQKLREIAPNLLTAEDVRFEERLRHFAGTGFWNQRPFFSRILDDDLLADTPVEDTDVGAIARCRQLQRERERVFAIETFTTEQIAPGVQSARENRVRSFDVRIHNVLKGYVAWLISEPRYVQQLSLLKSLCAKIHHPARLPGHDQAAHRRRAVNGRLLHRDLIDIEIFRSWSLDRIVTWHLPEPVYPVFRPGENFPGHGLAAPGFAVFVPWPMLADRTLTLSEVALYHRQRVDFTHLNDWIQGLRNWGTRRFARMLDLYVYRMLAIEARYGDRLGGQAQGLDQAFAAYWQPTADAQQIDRAAEGAKKILTKLRARLRAAEASLANPEDASAP